MNGITVASMSYRTVLLFGAPGSGKGTQGKILGQLPGYFHFACGDAFRSLDPKSEIGQVFARYSKTGSLVPDEFTVELWRQSIESAVTAGRYNPDQQILLLDGIPRTLKQATIMASKLDVQSVIYLFINDVEQIVERLRKRASVEKRADDTNIEIIRYRIDIYEEQTRPLLDFYRNNHIHRVNATQTPERVTQDVRSALERQHRRSEW
jgi:adenylate kinase